MASLIVTEIKWSIKVFKCLIHKSSLHEWQMPYKFQRFKQLQFIKIPTHHTNIDNIITIIGNNIHHNTFTNYNKNFKIK